jgi:hypothetical protein
MRFPWTVSIPGAHLGDFGIHLLNNTLIEVF